jgi:hypothetical protein
MIGPLSPRTDSEVAFMQKELKHARALGAACRLCDLSGRLETELVMVH